jgi:aminoglycoside 6-adenylyltransferase
MRSKDEMLGLILKFANENESVRAVMMNGSRVNPNVPADPLQDYDVVCFVRDVAEFRRNDRIPKYFGEIMILQVPEEMQHPDNDGTYGYLMQFQDGTRIDLGFDPVSRAREFLSDSLTVILTDKDGALGQVPPPSDLSYLTKAPTEKEFFDCCNEFWWMNPYVAKALWRDQLVLAKHLIDDLVRSELIQMLSWKVVASRGTAAAMGKHGCNLKRYLDPSEWALFKGTYVDSDYERIWSSLMDMGTLFRSAALRVADSLRYQYLTREDQLVSEFIRKIKNLPAGATDFA